jgi:hypothetical protein
VATDGAVRPDRNDEGGIAERRGYYRYALELESSCVSTSTVFLSATSLDLREWREVIHRALERAGLKVFTQDLSLGAPAGDVLALLQSHLDKSDYVFHLAGIAYGSAPDHPAFDDHPEFECSFTQFEYYYARSTGKPVFAFVCAADFPFATFVESGANEAERERRRILQQLHRDRVTKGAFDGTPGQGLRRTSSDSVTDLPSLLVAVAAAIGTIRDGSAKGSELQAAKHELERLASQHGRVTRRLRGAVGTCAFLLLAAIGIVLWQARDRSFDLSASRDALRYRNAATAEAARTVAETDPHRAAMLLREIPGFLAETADLQLARHPCDSPGRLAASPIESTCSGDRDSARASRSGGPRGPESAVASH